MLYAPLLVVGFTIIIQRESNHIVRACQGLNFKDLESLTGSKKLPGGVYLLV